MHHDGASYSGEDTLVSIVFLPRTSLGMMLPYIAVPRVVSVDDYDVDDDVERYRRERIVFSEGHTNVPADLSSAMLGGQRHLRGYKLGYINLVLSPSGISLVISP